MFGSGSEVNLNLAKPNYLLIFSQLSTLHSAVSSSYTVHLDHHYCCWPPHKCGTTISWKLGVISFSLWKTLRMTSPPSFMTVISCKYLFPGHMLLASPTSSMFPKLLFSGPWLITHSELKAKWMTIPRIRDTIIQTDYLYTMIHALSLLHTWGVIS